MRISRVLFLLLALASAAARTAAAQASDRVSRLGWLSGCWEQHTPRGVTTEMWSRSLGGMMIGASVSVRDGSARGFEHVRIREHGGRLQYTALPSGQRETTFTETVLSDSIVVFENPEHDFPQRLTYRRVGSDSLVARAEASGPQGPRGFDVPMARVACPGR
jgi:hypothetical protein